MGSLVTDIRTALLEGANRFKPVPCENITSGWLSPSGKLYPIIEDHFHWIEEAILSNGPLAKDQRAVDAYDNCTLELGMDRYHSIVANIMKLGWYRIVVTRQIYAQNLHAKLTRLQKEYLEDAHYATRKSIMLETGTGTFGGEGRRIFPE